MTQLGSSGLDVSTLCLGGNVFGWTADADASFAVLDAYVDSGGNFIDTADVYSSFHPGNRGGESEEIIGQWLTRAGRSRDDVVIATKCGQLDGVKGLSKAAIRQAAEDSLRRLGTDHIDLYFAHIDDEDAPLAETLGAFQELVDEGKVLALGASNYSAARLTEALDTAEREGLTPYTVLQPLYNLMERKAYENGLETVVEERGLVTMPYYALASGFLTGKYRPGGDAVDSPRAGRAVRYLDKPRGPRTLAALDEVAAAHDTTQAAVALAWLAAQPTVVSPIASARDLEQLQGLLDVNTLELTADEVQQLTTASQPD